MYRNVKNDISDISLSSDRCRYPLDATWHRSSVVKNGVKLAKELMNCNKERTHVWMMLAHFWAEMMLFIAPSDNVDGHEKILPRKELITQLWALLTHAGIISRPEPTKHQGDECESNEITGADNSCVLGAYLCVLAFQKKLFVLCAYLCILHMNKFTIRICLYFVGLKRASLFRCYVDVKCYLCGCIVEKHTPEVTKLCNHNYFYGAIIVMYLYAQSVMSH
ncbi:hypothetical protein FCM35_KLT09490 [Carex littledalei]|uniref:DUF4220 domain-containing protein n=1 Tax=Carex littledalei TaxID=544730 RepID=A0A833VJW7_9POAL|nr:hypothetical protein FCM35_KLT09490 [Carex littledalei]